MKKLLLLLSFLLVAGFLSACEDTADFADMTETDPIEPMNEEPGGGETAVSPTYQTADCPIDIPRGYDVACGYLTVPENRTLANSPAIELAVAIVAARDGADYPPVIYLAGGPGGSGLDDFAADPEGWDYPFTRNRDLILLDQRGTGYSIPTLDCPEFTTADENENPDELCYDLSLIHISEPTRPY